MDRQARRRDSRGWVEDGWVEEDGEEASFVRSVSGTPGAEGAPLEGCGRVMGISVGVPLVRVVVLVVLVGCDGWGVMWRDLGMLVYYMEGRMRWAYHFGE